MGVDGGLCVSMEIYGGLWESMDKYEYVTRKKWRLNTRVKKRVSERVSPRVSNRIVCMTLGETFSEARFFYADNYW